MKWIQSITATLLVLLAATVLEDMFSAETPTSHFSNYAAAQTSGLMDSGWIPDFIPKSATNIHEQHDLDINT